MCYVLEACPHSRLKLLHLLNAGLGKVNLTAKNNNNCVLYLCL